jgi:hypothetical protein
MTKRNRLTFSVIAAIILLACACPASSLPVINSQTATSAPVIPPAPPIIPTVAPQQQSSSSALISDDFSIESSEFKPFSDKSGTGETKDGVYIVRSISELWNWSQSQSEFDNTVTEVDLNMVSGPKNNNAGMGVICRLSSKTDGSVDGYLLAISGDGFYSIRSIAAGTMTALVDWTASDVINQGSQGNKIRATCNGSDLKLEVNGVPLATATADASGPQSGAIAFAAVSFETKEPTTEIHFDNLVVTKP